MKEERQAERWRIGELARRVGLNVRTLRYYEAVGLLPAVPRSESGYRLYGAAEEALLRFVLQARALGFRLEEIRRILELASGPEGAPSPCGYVREHARRHVAAIDRQMAALAARRERLAGLAAGEAEPVRSGNLFCALIQGSGSPMVEEEERMNGKRRVEVFTAGCPLCEPVVEMVRRIACPSCDVTVHNLKDDPRAAARAREAGVQRVPMVLVDGKPAECCRVGPVTEEGLRAAGVGAR